MQAALLELYPEAHALRADRIFNRITKDGEFWAPRWAPHFGYLWQSDLNLMLAKWGLAHGIVYDVCTRTVVSLTPLTNRLTATVWTQVNALAESGRARRLPHQMDN